jgi:DMSO/TMAO reductase YedYZ molybdopterin-dependent catalytic subunit
MIRRGLVAAAGVSGLAAAARIADRYGLVPPDHGGIYGPGRTLTFAAQRLLTGNAFAREFDRSQISQPGFANPTAPPGEAFTRLQGNGFRDWRLSIEGLVAQPMTLSVDEVRRMTASRQITELVCEEGWSYIAKWIGTPLGDILRLAGALPQARYVVYFSIEAPWWESIDMLDARHPQTLVTYAMNDGDLPVAFGGPLRLRIPRQLGYKSIKYMNRIVVTDTLKPFNDGRGRPSDGYDWYAGI